MSRVTPIQFTSGEDERDASPKIAQQPCPNCKDLQPQDDFAAHRVSICTLRKLKKTALSGCPSCKLLEHMSFHYKDASQKGDDGVYLMPGPRPRFGRWASSVELCMPKGAASSLYVR